MSADNGDPDHARYEDALALELDGAIEIPLGFPSSSIRAPGSPVVHCSRPRWC